MFNTLIDPFDFTRCPLFQSCCKTAGDGVRYYIDKVSNVKKKKKKPRCLLDLESLETIAHEHLKKWPERLIGSKILTNEGWIKNFAQHIKLNTQTKTALLIRCSYLVAPWVLDLLVTPVQAGLALLSDPWFLWTQTHTQHCGWENKYYKLKAVLLWCHLYTVWITVSKISTNAKARQSVKMRTHLWNFFICQRTPNNTAQLLDYV